MDSEQKLKRVKDFIGKEKVRDIHGEVVIHKEENGEFKSAETIYDLMERYANEVSKEYQTKILMFREELKLVLNHQQDNEKTKEFQELMSNSFREQLSTGETILDSKELEEFSKDFKIFKEHPFVTWYDMYFGITTQRKGEIVNDNNG